MMEASKREATRKGVQNPTAKYLSRNQTTTCRNQTETQQSQHGVSSTEKKHAKKETHHGDDSRNNNSKSDCICVQEQGNETNK